MKKSTLKFILLLSIVFMMIACSENSSSEDNENSIPTSSSLIGQTITFIDKNNPPYDYGLWIKPVNSIYCEAGNMTRTDSKYLYSQITDKTASLVIDGYQILTNTTYIYKWEMTLTFTSPTRGTFRGTYFKGNTNYVAAIAGDFYIGEMQNDSSDDKDDDNGNSGGNDDTESNPENETIKAVVSKVEEYNGKHSIYVYGEYADKNISKYLSVGFCANTKTNPLITDISIPQQIENPNNNSVRTISNLLGGTAYYIRPYQINNNHVTYYRSTSVETIGKNIKLSASIQNDHQFGEVSYDIKPQGTYELGVSFWSISGIKKVNLGYVSNTSGSKSFNVGSIVWSNYQDCTVSLTNIDTGIRYSYKINLGWTAGK